MRKFKAMLSIVLALTILCTSFIFAGTVSAATVENAEVATEANLQNNVQDGVILHAFCWGYSEIEENLAAIAAAGYTTIQTSPVQQPKDVSTSTDIAGQWWKLYQPVSLSIANNTWLGTKAELKSLCTAADKYGIKIICDIVANHLGASEENSFYQLDDEVKTYEPTLYGSNGATRNNQYFHQNFNNAGDSDAYSTTQGLVSACPDLNTGNTTVQGRVISLLKECIDCGVDGFRFDAAKHIETPSDGSYASQFWPNVINAANSYAGKQLYYYGEILNTPGSGRSYGSYTQYMSVTDNNPCTTIRNGVTGHSASSAANSNYNTGNASKSVLWAESHDTYQGTSENTQNVSNADIVKTWALVASRKDATALYFARPGSMSMGGAATDTTYKSVAVAEVNKFHNDCVGESEKVASSGNFAYVVRGTKGIVIVNTNGTTANASISGTGLSNGTYTDMITGNKFTVSGGTVSGSIGSTGIAVVTQGTTTPTVFADQESQTFEGESIAVKLSLSNATSGTYQLENYTPVSFTGSPTIRIGKDYNYGDTITLNLTATDGTKTTTTTYKYVKKQAASSGVYVILPASVVSSNSWKAPIKCYIYDEDTSSTVTYKNASWPGEQMQFDSTLNAYYVQVQDNSCLQQTNGSNTTTESTFNLAKSSNTYVIVNDSSSTNGATSAGKQFPSANSKTKLGLGGTSHKLNSLTASGWVTTTEKPGSTANVAATEVTKGNSTVPTTAPTTATQKPTTGNEPKIGDANTDGTININDVTAIQKHIALISSLTDEQEKIADTDRNGYLNIKDATNIQKHIAGMNDKGYVGQVYTVLVDPTTPPATEATTIAPVTQPTTATPVEKTYTAYFKTQLAWMTNMGCSVFLYDTNSGVSYLMEQDMSAYPNVFTANVPESCSSVIFYRALSAVDNPQSNTEAYNLMPATLSKSNNCYTVTAWDDTTGATGSSGPYVAEQAPDFSLSKLYFDNSVANWSSVYVYGWGYGINNEALPMTHISGTNIWYIELPQAIPDGVETFLFKDTGDNTWVHQSANITVQDPYNCYKLNSSSGGDGTWYTYNG